MPDRHAYDKAMLMPQIRFMVPEADLRQGSVEMVTIQTQSGPLKRPWGSAGGFAVVYKFRVKNGHKAIRCFQSDIKPDMQLRYDLLSQFFQAHLADITAGFHYYAQGIAIDVTTQGVSQPMPYPMIVMDWIEGDNLNEYVNTLCMQSDTTALKHLADQWLLMLERMRHAQMAHGDLAGGNIMVRKDGRMVLVDYDGVYIPEFQNRGLEPLVAGQGDYQHPQMKQRPFNEHMDDFSGYVIYTALRALSLRPALWNTYAIRGDDNRLVEPNLLFSRQDFLNPDQSSLFQELQRLDSSDLNMLVRELKKACCTPITTLSLPPLTHRRLKKERQRLKALEQFHQAIKRGNIEQIVQYYSPLVDHELLSDEKALLVLLQKFLTALKEENDTAIIQTSTALKETPYQEQIVFTVQQRERISLAQRRRTAAQRLRAALASKNIERIVSAYDILLENNPLVKAAEMECLHLARSFRVAYLRGSSDADIKKAWEGIQQSSHTAAFHFTADERQRAELAVQRQEALFQFRVAWQHQHSARKLLAAYNPLIESTEMLPEERERIAAAQRFLAMYDALLSAFAANNGNGDDQKIFTSYDEDVASLFTDLTPEQNKRIQLALKRTTLIYTLNHHMYRECVRLAQEIEAEHQTPVLHTAQQDAIRQARQKFLAQFQIHNIQAASLPDSHIAISWQWPLDTLIQHATIVWRKDRWPQQPEEAGTNTQHISRQHYERQGSFQFKAGSYTTVYVQVYFAIPEYTASRQKTCWLYSPDNEPLSRTRIKRT